MLFVMTPILSRDCLVGLRQLHGEFVDAPRDLAVARDFEKQTGSGYPWIGSWTNQVAVNRKILPAIHLERPRLLASRKSTRLHLELQHRL